MSSETLTPEVLWAQRSSKVDAEKNYVHLTVNVPDIAQDSLKLDLQSDKVNFTGTCTTHGKETYHFELPLYAEINVAASSTHYTQHSVRLKLEKKELKEEFWPRLQKESQKLHWLKTDFDRWVDEDEQDGAPDDDFSQFGGMGGMPGMGGGSDFGGIDFSQLGGADKADESDEDDDLDKDMPALEGDEPDTADKVEGKAAGKAPAKAEDAGKDESSKA